MTQRSDRPIVGFVPTVNALVAALAEAADGPKTVLIDGTPGSGRQTAVVQFLKKIEEEQGPSVLRFTGSREDDGIRALLRTYAALVTTIARGKGLDVDPIEFLSQEADREAEGARKDWLSGIATNGRDLRAQQAGGNFQIRLPQRNPYLGLLHALDLLGPRGTWIFDFHDIGNVVSPAFWVFLGALVDRARSRNWKVLFLVTPGENIYGEKAGEDQPGPRHWLMSLFTGAASVSIPRLTEDDIREFLAETYKPNNFPATFAAKLTELSAGHPETLHELVDALEEDETLTWNDSGYALSDLADVDFDVLVPSSTEDVDKDEEGDDGKEKATGPTLRERILLVAATEGRQFTSSLIRTVLDAAEDEVDDALDEMPQLVVEDQYHKALGAWTYKWKHAFYRTWYVHNTPDGVKEKGPALARRLATVMLQSYAPAAFEYVSKAASLYSDAGDARSARNLLALALGSDRPEVSQFALEVTEAFSDSPWPPGIVRLLYTGTADRATNAEGVEAARKAITRCRTWATREGDSRTLAYTELLECRVAVRQGEWDNALSKGEEALKAFEGTGDSTRAGETLNQLAMVALNKNDAAGAESFASRAEKASSIPPVRAHTTYIQGLLAKRAGQGPKAMAAFERAVELSTQAGNLILVLESLLNQGEMGLINGRGKEMAPLLERALEMSRALRAPTRERTAARLLCQAEAARGRAEPALAMARHALELTRELGQGNQEHVDLYHCGLFAAMSGKLAESVDYLTGARNGAEKVKDKGIMVEIVFNLGQVRAARKEWDQARGLMEQFLAFARQNKDQVREVRALEQLGMILASSGEHRLAAERFSEAADRAGGPEAKEFRKTQRGRAEQMKAIADGRAPAAPIAEA